MIKLRFKVVENLEDKLMIRGAQAITGKVVVNRVKVSEGRGKMTLIVLKVRGWPMWLCRPPYC